MSQSSKITVCFACLVTVWLGVPKSASAAETQQNQPDAISADILKLSSESFVARQEAFMSLWRLGAAALPALAEAKQSENRSTAKAAAILEATINLGLSADDELDMSLIQRVVSSPTPDQIAELCMRGYWELAEQILRESPELRRLHTSRQPGRFRTLSRLNFALRNAELDESWGVLSQVVGHREISYVAGLYGLPLPNTPDTTLEEKAEIEFYSGNVTKALSMEGVSAKTRTLFLARAGEFERFADPENLKVFTDPARSESVNALIESAVLSLAGAYDESDLRWAEVTRSLVETDVISPDAVEDASLVAQEVLKANAVDLPLVIFALAVLGHSDAIEQYLLAEEPDYGYVVLTGNSKHLDAIAALGLERDLSNFDEWLEDTRGTLPVDRQRMNRLASLCNLLINIGFPEQAEKIVDACIADVSKMPQNLQRRNFQAQQDVWSAFARYMTQTESRAVLLEKFDSNFASMNDSTRTTVLNALFPNLKYSIATLLETMPGGDAVNLTLRKHEDVSRIRSWKKLDLLSRYVDDDPLLSAAEVEKWLNDAMSNKDQLRSLSSGREAELIRIAEGYGLRNLAFQIAAASIGTAVPATRVIAARLYLDAGRPEVAANILRTMRQAGEPSYIPKEIEASLLAGDFEAAKKLRQFQMIAPLVGPRREDYSRIGNVYLDAGDPETAVDYLRAGMLLSEPFSPSSFFQVNSLALCLEELELFGEASNARRANAIEMLFPGAEGVNFLSPSFGYFDYLGFYIYGIQKDRMHRARALLASGFADAAWREIEYAHRLQPHDIELAVQCYQPLKELAPERAERLFQKFDSTLLSHLENCPNDSTSLNNLAWMYAKTGRKLDEGLQFAEKAVELSPQSDTFIDTLAEVHYQLGDTEKAIKLMQQCVKLNPEEKHYRQNLVRFRNQSK